MTGLLLRLRLWVRSNPAFSVYLAFWTLYFGRIWSRAYTYDRANNLIAGHVGLWGDWAAHFTMASSMAYRYLITTDSPVLINAYFHYPYFVNFISAALIRLGTPFTAAFTVPTFFMTLALSAGLFMFFRLIFRSAAVAFVSAMLYFFNGGIGFVHFIADVMTSSQPLKTLLFPPRIYTQFPDLTIQCMSVVTSIVIPQRAFQLGFPVALASIALVFREAILHRRSNTPMSARWLLAAAVLWGMLPVIHAHSFLAVAIVFTTWAIGDFLSAKDTGFVDRLRPWIFVAVWGTLVAIPWILLLKIYPGAGVPGMQWAPGWYAETLGDWFLFWWRNWLITPLVGIAGFWLWLREPGNRSVRMIFWSPFVLIFVLLNLILFQPWIWDNTKLLSWASVGISGTAGFAVVYLWRLRRTAGRIVSGVLVFLMTATGFVDNYRALIPVLNRYQMFTNEELMLADWALTNTDPHTVWLTSNHHNNWVFARAGRQPLMAYEGWLWTYGYNYHAVKRDMITLFKTPSARNLIDKYKIDFIVVGPIEEANFSAQAKAFAKEFRLIKKTDSYSIFETAKTPFEKHWPEARASDDSLSPVDKKGAGETKANGLTRRVFPNKYWVGPSVGSGTDAALDFWIENPDLQLYASPFSVEWTGFIRIPEKGRYTFSLESDDGSRLYLNDQLFIENDGIHSLREVNQTLTFEAGRYRIKVRYMNDHGAAVLKFKWGKENEERVPVPAEALSH